MRRAYTQAKDMLENLERLPEDPLLGLIDAFSRDNNPHKTDLGVGVYQDDGGNTPIMQAVRAAETQLLSSEGTKRYLSPTGDAQFNAGIQALVLGATDL